MAKWNAEKLDDFERELTARVTAGIDPAAAGTEERETAEVLGYWLYKLRECREEKGK